MVEDAEWLSLEAGESVVWWGQPRLRRILPDVARSLFWGAVFVAVAVVGPAFAPPDIPPLVVRAGGLVLALAASGWAISAYLRTRNVSYVLTDRNLYRKRGVLSTTVTRLGVANIQNTRLQKDFLGNLFDYGTVAVSTAGSRGDDLALTDLNDPETFRRELQAVMADTRSSRVGAASERALALDPDGIDALLTEARSMRETAERLAGVVAE